MSNDYQGDLESIFGQEGFNTSSVEPQGDFDVIPPGKYAVLIESASVNQTKAGNGHYIKLTLTVLEGQYKGRKVFDNINISNPNQQCVEIGLRQLAALGLAIGIPCVGDTSQLLNHACIAHVKVKAEQNEVRTYSPLPPAGAHGVPQYAATNNAVHPGQAAQPQYAPQPPATAPRLYQPPQQQDAPMQAVATGKPPWAR